jgi:hypothetical protein
MDICSGYVATLMTDKSASSFNLSPWLLELFTVSAEDKVINGHDLRMAKRAEIVLKGFA